MGAVGSRSTKIYKEILCAGVALSALALVLGTSSAAKAQSVDKLQAEIEKLQRSVNELKAQQAATARAASAPAAAAARMPVKGAAPLCDGHYFLERKPGAPLTIYTCGGEMTAYGNLDVSFDYTSKDVRSLELNGNSGPVGNFGWMPAISTNLSYVGVRGFQRLYDSNLNFVYQLEAGFEISATPSNKQSNSNLSDSVNGALFSRNSFVGVAGKDWGAIKIGKTDAPYKNSTAMFNPFSGEIGDYSVIMGNTGGDNRVEFGTRLSHAIWYESPNLGGFQFNALFAPGQNRSDISDNIASGESDCAGGNDPTSGAVAVPSCTDGGFSNAASANLSYTNGGFYATGAYERHWKVNRQGDIAGLYGTFPPTVGIGAQLFNDDVADEDAAKIGALYRFPTGTTIGGIFEHMHRYVSADLAFQNERSRDGTWAFISQDLTKTDSVHLGWAHAFKTPGDPGQHNDAIVNFADSGIPNGAAGVPPPTVGTVASNQNQADMVTGAYKRKLSDNLTWYTAVAATFNGPSAHYDLGAGGRGVTTDCHDASLPASGGLLGAGGHCFTGTTLMGVSTGVQYRF
jgi:predicted porin